MNIHNDIPRKIYGVVPCTKYYVVHALRIVGRRNGTMTVVGREKRNGQAERLEKTSEYECLREVAWEWYQ